MKLHRLAHLTLLATATLLVCTIIFAIIGYLIFLSTPGQGPFNAYRFRELSIGLLPYLLLTASFFAAWLTRPRRLQMILIAAYTLLGLYISAAGIAAWTTTGNLLTLLQFPIVLLLSLPSLILVRTMR